jgi:PmbA protein
VTLNPALERVAQALADGGFEEAEVYWKHGRSRRVEVSSGAEFVLHRQESGWAVRAGARRGSFFASGTGTPRPEQPWPEATGPPIRLPTLQRRSRWSEPSDLDSPLLGEREGLGLLRGLEQELAREMPEARLLRAVVEDGSSESELMNSRGVRARGRARLASLRVEATVEEGAGAPATLYLAEREGRCFEPRALARRLADQLVVCRDGTAPERDRGEFLLAPPVAVRLLAGLLPLFVGPEATDRVAAFRDRRGKIGSPVLTLIDNGRLRGGALEAPVDGEGVPTREVVLVEEGEFRQPLLAWWQAEPPQTLASGCSRRASWRDLPAPGPTHLYIKPRAGVSVGSLLSAMARGYYLLDATEAGRFDLEGDSFALPVCGFAVQGGRATAPVAGAWLSGSVGALLRGLQAVGRDLFFLPAGGMIGSATLLVTGLELRQSP